MKNVLITLELSLSEIADLIDSVNDRIERLSQYASETFDNEDRQYFVDTRADLRRLVTMLEARMQ